MIVTMIGAATVDATAGVTAGAMTGATIGGESRDAHTTDGAGGAGPDRGLGAAIAGASPELRPNPSKPL